jgi:peptidyl-prolyl cis-trans isomerase D
MLDFMRQRARSIWIKALFLVIALVFVFFGIGSFGDDAQVQVIVTVDDEPITLQEFQRAYRNVEANYREVYKERFTPELAQQMNLRQQTLDQLVDTKLLAKEARRIGFRASDEDVRQEIAASPTFHSYGSFSPDRYRRLLRYLRMTPQEFEEQQRNRLVIERFQKFINGSIRATDYEVEELFRFEQEQVNLAFLKIASADLVDLVTITEQQVREFYTNNTESFRIPERVRLHYVSYAPEDFEAEASVSEDEVLDFYNTHKEERFTEEKQVQARHILFSLADGVSDERKADTRSTAQGILERVRGGEDFAALAEEYSQDTGTAGNGGDLGFFGRDRMVKPFEEAAFGMEVGQVSDLVETTFGFHIIKVEAIQPEHIKPIEEVADTVTEELQEQKSRTIAEKRAREDRKNIADGTTLLQFAESMGLEAKETPLVNQNETIPGLGRRPKLVETALGQSPGQISDPVQVDNTWFLVSLAERAPSRIPEFTAVQEEVEEQYRSEQAERLAQEKADKLLTKLKETKDLASLAKAEALTVEETGTFARRGGYIPKIGVVPDLKTEAFRLTPEAPVASQSYTWGGSTFIAVLKEYIPADQEQLEEQRDDLRQSLLQRKKTAAYQELTKYLKERAKIEYNQRNLLSAL